MPLMHARSSLIYIQIVKPIILIVFLILYSAGALASAKEDYSKGVEFFKKGDYHSAIAKFESAEKKGMESTALYYNLGSAYYKIKKFTVSKKHFNRVAEDPKKRALAEFNLGLIALKENNKEEALGHFEYAATNSKDNKIVYSSKQQIAGLLYDTKSWKVSLVANIGYDDNISITPDNLSAGVDDTFYNLYAYADYVFHGKRKNGWLVDASYFNIDFNDSDDFDQDYYTIGLRNEHRLSSWDTITHLRYGSSTFGGDDLQSFYKLDVLGAKPLSSNEKIILQYRYDDFTSENPIYDYLEGWRQRAQIKYLRNTKKNSQQVYYEAELNKRGVLVTSLFSYEFSPTRHTVGGKYTHKFSNRWFLTGDLSYSVSDFPVSATVDRDDTRWKLGVLVDYRIDSTLLLKGNVKYINNDSSFDIYTYDKTIITLGVSKLF